MSNKTEQIEINAMPSTPSSHWRAEGTTDPHAGHYDGERAALAMGKLTDDELANGAFMNYDQPLNVHGIVAGTHSSPIAWMTAVKDRIRWLSRSLEKAISERDALAAELKALREQEPSCWTTYPPSGRYSKFKAEVDLWERNNWTIVPLYARPVPARELTDAAKSVLAEHRRQIEAEGWTPERDDSYINGELADAAASYALNAGIPMRNLRPPYWPWDRSWWKPSHPRQDLVKSAALILAEIERLDRAILKGEEE